MDTIFTTTTNRETIYDDEGKNFMVIKTVIDLGMEQTIIQFMRDRGRGNAAAITMYLGYYRACIVDWGGPRFVTQDNEIVPCIPNFVEALKRDDPLFLKVKARIHEVYFGEAPDAPSENTVLDPNAGSRPTA